MATATTAGGVHLVVTSNATPPPPAATGLTCFGRAPPVSPHKVNALFTFGLGVAMVISSVLGLIGLAVTFNLLGLFVAIILMALGPMVAWSQLFASAWIQKYIGLLRFPFGSGCVLMVGGALQLGTSSTGFVLGIICMVWGGLSILMHFWMRGHNQAFNVPLCRRG